MDDFRFLRNTAGVALAAGLAMPSVDARAEAERLPAYGVDLAQTSVSGISSGAYLAVQFHVAHSGIVRGAGVIAGGPYYCAENSVDKATRNCMKPDAAHPVPDVTHLKSVTDQLAQSGAIDDPVQLQDDRVWLFSGTADSVVEQPVMDALLRYYHSYVDDGGIIYKKDLNAGHAMVTETDGAACAYTGPPFINDCDYDAAGALLAHIYGPLTPPAAEPTGRFVVFDQNEFLPDRKAHDHSLSDSGTAYIPEACTSKRCRVHVALHGCLQNEDKVDDAFYRQAGYNRWADTNDLIVLYPQTTARYGLSWPYWTLNVVWNPNACWDWWGYDSADYHTKDGVQIKAIRGMLDRLAETKP
ncbi:hypothetical protein [Methylocaldum sp.]|uniref:extracellular catalytic domain type 2 short-chain-length polyhydroxyalkanoate depolymerase n=1 Tax=Methylocaldum sp. TaxID=1969727 RepID=UPI002D40491B|nr:hypothetical protein [Methylocaldum sp.]HYE36940.1 hypothetical protein [Methylocaldum sp.]